MWYYIELFIFKSGSCSKLNEDKTIISRKDVTENDHEYFGTVHSCYGSVTMPSLDNKLIYEYSIKILNSDGHIAIGIDDASCRHCDTYFVGQKDTPNYGCQCWNGTKSSTKDTFGDDYAERCATNGAIIKMIYNSFDSTLSFIITGVDYGIAYDVVKQEGLEYRLAIYLSRNASVQLMGLTIKATV